MDEDKTKDIDRQVLRRVAASSRATQRWLKTALQTIRTMPPAGEAALRVRPVRPGPAPAPPPESDPAPERRAPDLDDLLTGRRSLKEQLEARPELAEELEGLADVIGMLRELGRERRKKGEDILGDDFLSPADDEEEPDEDV
ncbi:MAG: hypothetical protein IH797_07365 [Chloroflexi bacterium]|nr:hypothetical protein [Chloroflexota bacterium]